MRRGGLLVLVVFGIVAGGGLLNGSPASAAGFDDFATRAPISGAAGSLASSNSSAATALEPNEPRPCANIHSTVWFEWTPAVAGEVSIDTAGSAIDTVLAVYTGTALNSLTNVACNDDQPAASSSKVQFLSVALQTYVIQVGTFGQFAGGSGNFNLRWNSVANDAFADSVVLLGEQSVARSAASEGATLESGEPTPCPGGSTGSVWYTWTPPVSGPATIDTIGSNYDTYLSVFTGSTLTGLMTVGCNDDLAAGDLDSRVSFSAAAGVTYRIQIRGLGTILKLQATEANDAFANAAVLAGTSGAVTASSTRATREVAEPLPCGAGGRSIWYAWTPASSGRVTLDTYGSSFDTVLSVNTGSAVGALTPIDCNNDASGVTISAVSFDAVGGTTYRIAVDGSAGATGAVTLRYAVGSGIMSRIGFVTPGRTTAAGVASDPMTVQVQDFAGNAVVNPGPAAVAVALGTGSATGSFRDASGGMTITSVMIPSGGSTATFRYRDTRAGSVLITVTSAGLVGATQTQTIAAASLNRIVLTPSTSTIVAGDAQVYAAEGFDEFNNTLGNVTASTTFSVAPNGSCAGASCRATQVGSHTVTAANGSVSQTATLHVNAGPLHHLAISPSNATIAAGATQAFTSEGRDQFDNPLGDRTASTVLTIAPDGSCAGTGCGATVAGSHTVSGSSGTVAGTAALNVIPDIASSVVLTLVPDTVEAGSVYPVQARAVVNDRFGNGRASDVVTLKTSGDALVTSPMTATSPAGRYSSAVQASTTVGAETITASVGPVTGTAVLHEVAGPPRYVSIVASPNIVSPWPLPGSESTVTMTVTDTWGNPVPDVPVDFEISQNESGLGLAAPAGPSLSARTVTTNAAGLASVRYQAGVFPGEDMIVGRVGIRAGSVAINVAVPLISAQSAAGRQLSPE